MGGHKYNPEQGALVAAFLNNNIRKLFLSPEKVLHDIGIQPSGVWADVGCGSGLLLNKQIIGWSKQVYEKVESGTGDDQPSVWNM